jgi:Kef-type K+ transport system membrane component KefB
MKFLIDILIVLAGVKLAGQVSQRFGQPAVLGQLLSGLLMGPAVLGWVHPGPLIKELAELGVILLMFLAGLETNFRDFRQSALPAVLVAIGGVVLPFAGGWAIAEVWGYDTATSLFVGVLLVATSVSISAQTLRELGHLRNRPGVTILAAAVVDDVLGILVLSLVLGAVAEPGAAEGGHGGGHPAWLLLKMAIFFALAGLAGWKLLPGLFSRICRSWSATSLLTAGIVIAVGFAYAAEAVGLAGIIGAYLAGLSLSTTHLRHDLMHAMEPATLGFFAPFFLANVGLSTSLSGVGGGFFLLAGVFSAVAVLTKVVGAGLGAVLAGIGRREALGIGAGMVARGEVGLIVAAIGLERGVLTEELYTAMVVICLVTTLVTPPLLKLCFAPRRESQTAA